MNQAAVFGLLGVGAILLDRAVTGQSIGSILQGNLGTVSGSGVSILSPSPVTTVSNVLGGIGQGLSSAIGPVGSPPALPYGTALTGQAGVDWANAILKALGAPATSANVASLQSWFAHEGGGGQNNPMNTTLQTSDATGSINSAGVKNYSSPSAGVSATVQTLQSYPAIVTALRSGQGLSNAGPAVASELSTWSGGGYSSLG